MDTTKIKIIFVLGYLAFQEWFIPTLCRYLDSSSNLDIARIVTKTNKEVSTYLARSFDKRIDGGMQVLETYTTLLKEVYL